MCSSAQSRQARTARAPTGARRLCSAATISTLLLLGGCGDRAGEDVPVALEISHVVGAQPLQIEGGGGVVASDHVHATAGTNDVASTQSAQTATGRTEARYRRADGKPVSITRLRYYLSNFRLRRAEGGWATAASDAHSSAGYFLVDAAQAASQSFEFIRAPAGAYSGLEFLLGVDDARNTAGAQTGTLDPARGMFWTWHSGYIFLMLEGRSYSSEAAGAPHESDDTAEARNFAFHVGGATPAHLSRSIYLQFGAKPLTLRAGTAPSIHLHADVGALLAATDDLRRNSGDDESGHDPSGDTMLDAQQSAALMDAAATMFGIDHVHQDKAAPAAGGAS